MPSVEIERTGDWSRVTRVLSTLSAHAPTMIESAVKAEAERAAKAVRDNIDSGGKLGGAQWAPLSPLTLALAPNAKPLQGKNGELRDAVKAFKVRKGQYMIGVKRGARGRSGVDLLTIASVHENGAQFNIAWTPARLRAFWGLVRNLIGKRRPYVRRGRGPSGSQSSAVRIPARPFLRPMLNKMRAPTYGLKARAQQYFMRRVLAIR